MYGKTRYYRYYRTKRIGGDQALVKAWFILEKQQFLNSRRAEEVFTFQKIYYDNSRSNTIKANSLTSGAAISSKPFDKLDFTRQHRWFFTMVFDTYQWATTMCCDTWIDVDCTYHLESLQRGFVFVLSRSACFSNLINGMHRKSLLSIVSIVATHRSMFNVWVSYCVRTRVCVSMCVCCLVSISESWFHFLERRFHILVLIHSSFLSCSDSLSLSLSLSLCLSVDLDLPLLIPKSYSISHVVISLLHSLKHNLFIHSFAHELIESFARFYLFIHSCMHPFFHSFIHSFIQSLICSFAFIYQFQHFISLFISLLLLD